jgi:GTP pyrophosphokinase
MKQREQKLLSIEDILTHLAGTEEDRRVVRRAYECAQAAHEGQTRKTGEPYIQHSLQVAMRLVDLHLDSETIAAGLLHDVVEDNDDYSVEDLREAFGPSVAEMVDGVTKLQSKFEEIDRLGQDRETTRDADEWESLRKMFMAMARDARVILIKLADRLHNMRTLSPLAEHRRRALAAETMEIYAPLANRLGVWRWKWQLEDLAFRELQPDIYYRIADQIVLQRGQREVDIEQHIALLRHHLWLEGIKAEIDGRPKHIYSIYRKMQRKRIDLERVYDIQAIRVMVDTVTDCYQAIGVVHGLWTPIPGEFDDYIATPKENGYQSLHTAVVGIEGKTLEVQIRTHHMHRVAENGIAAHWQYKEGNRYDPLFERQIASLRAQIEAQSYVDDAKKYVEEVTADFFQDRVYALTPKGQVVDLPAGATPIDFAYYIHTEIGHRARGSKVNGRWVGLDYVLRTGDQVEIITMKKASPSRDWLNPALGYVRTSRARSKIRQWLRKQDREKNVSVGRAILERELKRLGVGEMAHESVATLMGYEELEDFLAAIGFGDVHSQHIASKVLEAQREKEKERAEDEHELRAADVPHEIHVLGTAGFLTRLAQCCSPLPGDSIVGYVTRGRGITIHRRDCPNVINNKDDERLIEVSWGTKSQTFSVPIRVQVYDRRGLLHEVSGVVKDENINISTVSMGRQDGLANLYLTLEVEDAAQLWRIMARIAKLPNVVDVRRQT